MHIKIALHEVREAFREAPLGMRWYSPKDYSQLFDMEPCEALAVAEAAVREMEEKHALDDASFFALQNELSEKTFVYNLILKAINDNGEVNLNDEDFAHFREKTENCCLMDYGVYVDKLLERVLGCEEKKLPDCVRGFIF